MRVVRAIGLLCLALAAAGLVVAFSAAEPLGFTVFAAVLLALWGLWLLVRRMARARAAPPEARDLIASLAFLQQALRGAMAVNPAAPPADLSARVRGLFRAPWEGVTRALGPARRALGPALGEADALLRTAERHAKGAHRAARKDAVRALTLLHEADVAVAGSRAVVERLVPYWGPLAEGLERGRVTVALPPEGP